MLKFQISAMITIMLRRMGCTVVAASKQYR